LFQSLTTCEHCLRGFTNRDIRAQLAPSVHLRACRHDPAKQSAKVSEGSIDQVGSGKTTPPGIQCITVPPSTFQA
jgi:hypothetical protein